MPVNTTAKRRNFYMANNYFFDVDHKVMNL